jgi:hypothetical protein
MNKEELQQKLEAGVILIRPQACFVKVNATDKEQRWRVMRFHKDPKNYSHGWSKWNDMTYKTKEECIELGCKRIIEVHKELDIDIEMDIEEEVKEEKPKEKVVSKPVKEPKEEKSPKPKYDKEKIIAGLEKRLEAVKKKAESISTDIHGNYTHKRASEAEHRAKEKQRQEQWARTIEVIIEKWRDDTLPEELKTIRSVSDIETIQIHKFPNPPDDDCPIDGWYRQEYPARLKKFQNLGITSYEQQKDISLILNQYGALNRSPEEERKINLSNKIKEFRGMKIPGFFPTPDGLIDIMIDRAELDNGMTILEPSAGLGNIPDRIIARGYDCNIDCCERQKSLVEILGLKGYKVPAYDFFDLNPFPYDRIIMNPPFEKGQDVEHVTRAFNQYLKEEGILVSIMSSGVRSNQQQKFVDFRELVDHHGDFYDVPAGSFKDSFNPTGVSVCICVLRK